MRIDNGTWVLVADGEKFVLLQNNGNRAHLDLRVVRAGAVENPPTREQGTDRPGRLDNAAAGPSSVRKPTGTAWRRNGLRRGWRISCGLGLSAVISTLWSWLPIRRRLAFSDRSCTRRYRIGWSVRSTRI